MNSKCPFCNIDPSIILGNNDLAVIIPDRHPVASGHCLVVPKRHFPSFFQATTEEKQSFLTCLDLAKSLVEKDFKPDGYNIGINDGEAAGQTISHLHIHLIPRYEGDASDPRGGIRWVLPDKAPYWEINE